MMLPSVVPKGSRQFLDSWPSGTVESEFFLFLKDTTFVVFCYSDHRKAVHTAPSFLYTVLLLRNAPVGDIMSYPVLAELVAGGGMFTSLPLRTSIWLSLIRRALSLSLGGSRQGRGRARMSWEL